MLLLNKIIEYLAGKKENYLNDENTYNIIINNIAHILAFSIILVFGIVALAKEQYVHSTILLVSSIIVILSFYFMNQTSNYKISRFVIVSLISFLLIYLITSGLNEGSGTLWFYTYPLLCLFLLGLKSGSIYFLFMLIVSLVVFYFSSISVIQTNYSSEFKFRFILSFIVVYIITFIYEYLKTQIRLELEKKVLETHSLNKSKSEFITRLSHQLRTPLNSILGLSSLLKNTELSKNQREYIETIDTSTNNLINVIKEIVEVTKIDDQTEKFNELSFDLNETIKNSLLLFKQQNENRDLKFNLSYSKFIPRKLVGIPVKVKQVFYNIIETCLSAANKKSHVLDIYVNNKKETDIAIEVLFEIHSGSIDIPIDIIDQQYEKDKLFQFFNDENLINENKNSSALLNNSINKFNLSVSQEIIELYGGRIGVNRKECGTVVFWFTMLFWKTKKENIPIDSEIEQKKSVESVAFVKKKLKNANVLIVEDNLINQKVIYLGLKEFVNSIEMAHNGKEAIDLFSKSKYDIVLMDIQMPIMDGYKTARKIRELETSNNIHTPIIAMTANAMNGDKEKCLKEGMDEYISKPYQMNYLIKRMEYQLSDH